MRLIDADLPRGRMESLYEYHLEMHNFSADGAVCDCLEILDEAPTIDAEPVRHGRWVTPTVIGGYEFGVPHCSACDGIPAGVYVHTDYCPHCGAKMDEVSE